MCCKGDKLVVIAGFKNFELGSERGTEIIFSVVNVELRKIKEKFRS